MSAHAYWGYIQFQGRPVTVFTTVTGAASSGSVATIVRLIWRLMTLTGFTDADRWVGDRDIPGPGNPPQTGWQDVIRETGTMVTPPPPRMTQRTAPVVAAIIRTV